MKTAAVRRLSPQRPGSKAALLVAVALAAGLAGCKSHGRQEVAGWLLADPAQRHPIRVGEREVGMDIAVPRGAYGLTRAQAYEARDFIRRYRQESDDALLVRAPSGTPNEVAAMRALDDLHHVLKKEGVRREEVVFEPYYGGGDPRAPVRLSYLRYVADGPQCGDWSRNVARDPKNVPYPNFGCATQRNLAAVVANPRDLIEPRGMTPRSSERRDTIWSKWVKGEPTGATKSDDENANVSEVESGGGGG